MRTPHGRVTEWRESPPPLIHFTLLPNTHIHTHPLSTNQIMHIQTNYRCRTVLMKTVALTLLKTVSVDIHLVSFVKSDIWSCQRWQLKLPYLSQKSSTVWVSHSQRCQSDCDRVMMHGKTKCELDLAHTWLPDLARLWGADFARSRISCI